MTRLSDDRRTRIHTDFTPVILSMGWTADLYRSVTFSISPGRRMSAIVGPRGATEAQVTDAVWDLVAYMKK